MSRRILVTLTACLLWAVPVLAQIGGPVSITAVDPATSGAVNKVGDATNNALRVNLVGTNVIRVQDGSGNALTSLSVGAQRAITVAVVDSSGNQVTAFGGAGGTASNFTSAFPAAGTAVGFSDGSNMQGGRVFDLDSGAGTQYILGANLRRTASGGSVELLGSATSANSLPVVIASDQGAVSVSQSGAWSTRTQDGSGNNITSRVAGSSRPLEIVQLDGSGNIVTPSAGTGTSSNFGSAFPASGTASGFYDGTNMQGARVVDADTSGGTFYAVAVNLIKRTSGTPTELIGQGTMANSVPVALASDQSAIPVTVGAAATSIGKAEDSAHTSADVGVMMLGVRESTAVDLSVGNTNGDYEPFQVDANGYVWVNPFPASPVAGTYLPVRLTDGSGFIAASTQLTHDGAMTVASVTGGALFARASAAAPTNVSASDDAVLPWALLNGSLVTNLASGGTLIAATGTSLNMNCTGGCSGGVQFAEDSAATDGVTLTGAGAVRQDTIASSTSADGDWTYLKTNSVGALYTSLSYLGANALLTGNGTTGTGSMRVTLASDTSSNTNAFFVNLGQVNGNTALAGNGVTGTGSARVTIASDNTAYEIIPAASATRTDMAVPCDVKSGTGTLNDTTNHANCKASAGNFYGGVFINTSSSLAYLRLYNLTTDPTCSSSTGFKRSIPIPHATGAGAGFVMLPAIPWNDFDTGIGYCITGAGANNDNTAPPAGVYGSLFYK